ncbi:hypothetical protein [Actinopolymorpha sp. B9G3]|uniref:hypothetical protein n=1 Tax=Actinopolymorpha sp. B9G3 TaxID=3158970 RepID=UPI0032D9990C
MPMQMICARDIVPGMVIRYASAWFQILAISGTAHRPLAFGASTFVAEAVSENGTRTSLLLHEDDYGYRLRHRTSPRVWPRRRGRWAVGAPVHLSTSHTV